MGLNFSKVEFLRSAGRASDFLRDGLPQFAFAGRSNVGKSSVINRLAGRKNLAYVGASPGKTTQVNYFLVDQRADVLITVRCGQNAAQVFQAAGMKILRSAHKTAGEDLAALEAGELEELTRFHGGFHGVT